MSTLEPAVIRWRARFRSFHNLRLMIKLMDGTMLLADYEEPPSTYWRETEFYIVDIPRWRVMDEKRWTYPGIGNGKPLSI